MTGLILYLESPFWPSLGWRNRSNHLGCWKTPKIMGFQLSNGWWKNSSQPPKWKISIPMCFVGFYICFVGIRATFFLPTLPLPEWFHWSRGADSRSHSVGGVPGGGGRRRAEVGMKIWTREICRVYGVKVVSTRLWNTPLNLYQQSIKGILS